ncbi:MAG: hypothetical protein RBT61_02275, partial [Candidatus Kapabacteria bacterium]|nr:hypothetical protein [Candidatus Kapabacteria bacterium]
SDSWINIALPDYLRIGDAENISVLSMLGTDMRNEVKILGNFEAGAVIKMDVNSLPAGIYIIKIANRFQKFIKY